MLLRNGIAIFMNKICVFYRVHESSVSSSERINEKWDKDTAALNNII